MDRTEDEIWKSIRTKIKAGELDSWKLLKEEFGIYEGKEGESKFQRIVLEVIGDIIYEETGLTQDDIEDMENA